MENLPAVLEAENLLAKDEELRQRWGDGKSAGAAIGHTRRRLGHAKMAKSAIEIENNQERRNLLLHTSTRSGETITIATPHSRR